MASFQFHRQALINPITVGFLLNSLAMLTAVTQFLCLLGTAATVANAQVGPAVFAHVIVSTFSVRLDQLDDSPLHDASNSNFP